MLRKHHFFLCYQKYYINSADPKYGTPKNINTPAEYGAPYARFIVKGTVLSEVNNKAIANIKILGASDTIFSDINGKFQIEKTAFPNDNKINLSFEDTDGRINEEFLSLDYEIDFKEVPFTGGDGSWNNGEALKEVNIHLKQKK